MKVPSFFAALILIAATLAPLSRGQEPSYSLKAPLPACDGIYAIVRLAEISPASNIDQYMQALALHKAWYQKHGYKDQIFAARVLERDPQTGTAHFSNHTVLTYHFIEKGSQPPVHDAEWDAYVKAYMNASSLTQSWVSCIPSDHIPVSMK